MRSIYINMDTSIHTHIYICIYIYIYIERERERDLYIFREYIITTSVSVRVLLAAVSPSRQMS